MRDEVHAESISRVRAKVRGTYGASRTLFVLRRMDVDWQPLYGHLRQRLSPAFLNSTGLMYPSFECSLKLLYQWT